MARTMGLAFALDLNAFVGAVAARSLPIFGSYGFEKFFQPKQGRADVTNFQRKLDFPVILKFFLIF